MKNLFLVLVLLISIVEINAQVWNVKKDTTYYESNSGKEIFWDSVNNVLVLDEILQTREIIENIDTLGRTSLEIIHKGISEQLLKELFLPALWNFEDLEKNKKTKINYYSEEIYKNLKKITIKKILYATLIEDLLILELEEPAPKEEFNEDVYVAGIILLVILFLQLNYFIPNYRKLFRRGKKQPWDELDFIVLIIHMLISIVFFYFKDEIIQIIPSILFVLGLIFRLGLLFNPPKNGF